MSDPAFSNPSLEDMNRLLTDFDFESVLSANAVGAVYYARQKSKERHVALKVFSREKGNDDRFLISLKRSVSLVACLNHANVIQVFDSGIVDGRPFLVMEFVPGKSLHRSTRGHTVELKQSLAIISEVCEGMAHAHARNVVHGNLSPLNILLTQQAKPKIGNFALGRGIHTLPDFTVPTHFSSPEVLAGEVHTVASDIYSLGAILYELITATPYRVGAAQVSELEGAPKALDAVIGKACAQNPKERYKGAMDFCHALEDAIYNKPSEIVAPVADPSPPASESEPEPERARKTAMELAMSTTGTGILVKVVIILVLCIAIQQVWSYRKGVVGHGQSGEQGEPQSGGSEVASFEMTKQEREARQRQEVQEQQPPDVVDFPDDPETPIRSLERLRDALKAGNFTELPMGTVSESGRHRMLIEQAMSWEEAAAHAEQHGGSIALPDGNMGWSKKEPFAGRSLWLGAARSGQSAFTLLNGNAWQPAAPVAGDQPYVLVDESGQLGSADASARLPYVIEWAAGSKPATLETRLAATAASIQSGQAVYPPGTIAHGERHYLPVARALTWQEADSLAKSSGGGLMVLSSESEVFDLQNWSARLGGGPAYWVGAHLVGEEWQWSNGEPWQGVKWVSLSNAAAEGAAMVLRSGGIDAVAASGTVDGFIIEWSADVKTNKPKQGQQTAPLASPTELTDVARQLVAKAIADKEAAHVKNTEKLAWDLNAHLRGLKKSDQEEWAPEAEKLKACVQNNRLLKESVDGSGARLSPFMSKLCEFIIRKQGEIDEQHAASLKAIHASYLKKLEAIRDQANATGQVKAQVAAAGLIDSSQNLEAWIASMSVAAP